MIRWFCFSSLILGLTVAFQEPVEFLTFYDSTPEAIQSSSQNGVPVAVHMPNEHLKNVSSSVLTAESWVRNNVLAYYPGTNISVILVGHNLLCENLQEKYVGLVLPSIKNIYYSLTRWGLQNEIKVSALFSSSCLEEQIEEYRFDYAEKYIKPLFNILQEINSPYVVNPHSSSELLSDETTKLLKSHLASMKKLGFFHLNKIYVVSTNPKFPRATSRKLSSIFPFPFPARPTPLAPAHAPTGFTSPAYAANGPLPPLVGKVSPPPLHYSPPALPPLYNSPMPPLYNSPTYGPHLPPCNPSHGGSAGAPVSGGGVQGNGLWCVAKPSVPPETLQEALDYACGEGGANCDPIRPNGRCYFPDTVLAHASYAFNSYWQKTKKIGGTCSFGGTAMLINTDPSFNHCKFILA